MSGIKLGTGTYIVREDAARDLFAVMERLAAIGYDGIELLGFNGKKPSAIKAKADALGITVMGDHVSAVSFLADPDRTISDHLELGAETVVISWPGDIPRSPWLPEYQAMTVKIAGLSERLLAEGIQPLFHNHGGDFESAPAHFDAVLDAIPGMGAEPDIGWMIVAGVDPIFYLEKYRERTPVIHLKDVYFENWSLLGDKDHLPMTRGDKSRGSFEFRPTGYGVAPNALLAPYYLACSPRWILVDHDLAYDRDPYEDLRISLDYVRGLLKISQQ
ncbi:MAG: sugar phosphate isomerase/epimerase [Oscillospiraceae bacterium]|nr:sugar phosphate isomerase/epimerase [Oscillospiraceae bacterium]